MANNIDGMTSLVIKLKDLENLNLQVGLERACLIVENAAKEKAPAGTGQLRRSITHIVNDNEGIVGTNLEYAPYVEFGTGLFSSKGNGRKDVPWRYKDVRGQWHTTSGQAPQPYLQPALLENEDLVKETIIKEAKEAIKEIC